ncbi:hypothetical protein HOY34_07320 [Xinfangfangia sp. D13-10-4-6]|uniref:hypothetical protein n=1 Tax=Pseudogemmobacter hezensis TaxID=2737662 RepID=UPI0015556391|nr:hypothetical protein [Pseudogemmobacter hezensis]NPD15013.1 hypothetical protein [Pseudogemmobacter hezensis]
MNRRQYLRQIARQSLIGQSPCEPPHRPLAALCATLPAWARSAGTRLLLVLDQGNATLNEDQKWGSVIAAGIATGNADLIQAVLRDAEVRIPHQTRDLAQRAAVASLLAQQPASDLIAQEEPPNEPGAVPPQDQEAAAMALFSLAAAAAWAGQVDLLSRLHAVRAGGVRDGAINSILGIAHTLAVIATILNGGTPGNTAHSQGHPLAS